MGSLPCEDGCICGRHRLGTFWDRVAPAGDCLVWTGSVNRKGYGRVYADGAQVMAHRRAWELAHGPIPSGQFILHTCDNPPCVNPAHLFIGTNDDNVQDMVQKSRQQRGSGHYAARFTDEQVRELRERHARTGEGYRRLAREVGVPTKTMQDLLRRKTYRDA